jgi:uncharacterized protein YbjT (DUF2867 family)
VILVFGASGNIGAELVSILSADGVPAIAVSRTISQPPTSRKPLGSGGSV